MKRTILFASLLSMGLCACNTSSDTETKNNVVTKADTTSAIKVDATTYQSANQEAQKMVYEFIKNAQTYYLATTEGDQPRVRPFGTVNIFEGKLYIQTGHKKNVAKQIATNPKVGICAFNGKEWVRVATTLVEDERIEAKKAMLDAYPNLRSMYDENDGNTAVYFMTDAEAKFSAFGSEDEVVKF
ncbi:MAG: pyridoxamine 5'-phosphate oxidase family protein [Paludibacteraceae bacterium]|nr:pyridoxamine 5'-phosphate oxidase family protein [Paludibacteraceae bacterium]